MSSSIPITVFERTYRKFFGIVKIHYMIEDRRPDISIHEKRNSKFKKWLTVSVFGRKIFNSINRGATIGEFYINGKDILEDLKCRYYQIAE